MAPKFFAKNFWELNGARIVTKTIPTHPQKEQEIIHKAKPGELKTYAF